jgi:hypothetical protein
MWEAIARTAERIERGWSRAGYRGEPFPELAEEAVAELLADRALAMDGILSSLASSASWSEQLDPHTQFGEPAVTVYKTERWNLDVYFWLHPVTALHDHRFRGAFGVVEGLTLNSTYQFEAREDSPRGVEVGRLALEVSELLHPGAVRRILPGRGFIHQVVHLARPTVSIALRTAREPDLPLQREYFRPGLSVPALQNLSPSQRRKLDLIGTLLSLRHPEAEALTARMLSAEEEACAFWMLYRLFPAGGLKLDAALRVLDRADSRLGRFREELTACLSAVAESGPHWSAARQEPHRLLLALATSIPDAEEISRRVEEYSRGEAASAAIPRWLAEMKKEADGAALRSSLGKRAEPLGRLDLGPRPLLLLRGILEGEDRTGILRRARNQFPEDRPEDLERSLDELDDSIGRLPMLRPFLTRWKQRSAVSD